MEVYVMLQVTTRSIMKFESAFFAFIPWLFLLFSPVFYDFLRFFFLIGLK